MGNLKFHVPEFERCCFCIPLRNGLIAYGVLKLFLFLYASFSMLYVDVLDPITWILAAEMVLTIFLVAAAIMKNMRILRVYYICSLIELIAMVGLYGLSLMFFWPQHSGKITYGAIYYTFITIFIFCVQGYVIMLVRSELMKLQGVPISEDTNVTVNLEPECQEIKTVTEV